jgi:phosphate:Na+ symporter
LGSGLLVTALVQSSSAVTVAAIGFINAGLLGLAPALWVLFGSNVGSTMTGWIVALVGLKFNIEALALPLVGAGMALRLTGSGQRRGAIGTALAGFGLLFLGIAMLQQSFDGLAGQVVLPHGDGPATVLAQVAIGVLMTVLMQSSAASMTLTLTAAQGGLLSAQGAAAVVIGANLGTTVTALLAAIGATPNARRAAAAHVIFNAITGCVALALLPWLIGTLEAAREVLALPSGVAAGLALFHTTFNVLGVLLMWPLATSLTHWLQQRFRAREDDDAQPQFLDDNVLAVPTLAMSALEREVARMGHLAVQLSRSALAGTEPPILARAQAGVTQLDAAVEAFVERMNRGEMPQRTAERLARTLRVQRYHETTAEQALAAAPLQPPAATGPAVDLPHVAFVQRADALLALCDPTLGEADATAIANALQATEAAYQELKSALLAAGAAGGVHVSDMETALRRYSAMRRAVQQAAKARQTPASRTAQEAGSTHDDIPYSH